MLSEASHGLFSCILIQPRSDTGLSDLGLLTSIVNQENPLHSGLQANLIEVFFLHLSSERPPEWGDTHSSLMMTQLPKNSCKTILAVIYKRFIDRNQYTGVETRILRRGRGLRPRMPGRRGI